MVDGLSRGELAKQGHVNFETIRFYEQEGLLPKPPRTDSGYRQYPAAVRQLQFIKRGKELGFSLQEIRELLDLRVKPSGSCADVCRKAQAKIDDVEEKIRHLRKIRKALAGITATCSRLGPI